MSACSLCPAPGCIFGYYLAYTDTGIRLYMGDRSSSLAGQLVSVFISICPLVSTAASQCSALQGSTEINNKSCRGQQGYKNLPCNNVRAAWASRKNLIVLLARLFVLSVYSEYSSLLLEIVYNWTQDCSQCMLPLTPFSDRTWSHRCTIHADERLFRLMSSSLFLFRSLLYRDG